MLGTIFAFVCSVAIIQVMLMTNQYHRFFSYDNDLVSIQKYHTIPTPRIGGIGVFISFIVVIVYERIAKGNVGIDMTIFLGICLVFFIGVLEDITKSITPTIRITVITLSALVEIYTTSALPTVTYFDCKIIEQIVATYPILSIIISLFCVVGLTNAYNIIDGYHGLSTTTAIANLLGLLLIAFYVHDMLMLKIIAVLIGAILGFWIFNYPWGKIFIGDGGAYTMGFIIAIVSIYLVHTYRGQISPYAVLLMAIYPITEIGFSIFRRKFLLKTDGMKPDAMHLHQLIYSRCTPLGIKNRNSRVMPLMLFYVVPQAVLAVVFYQNTRVCLLLILCYIAFYVYTYFSLVRFRTFNFLKIMLK